MANKLTGSINFSQLKQNWAGEWNEGTVYNLNDTVRVNGKAYVCNTTAFYDNKSFGQEFKPGTDTTNWTLVINGSVFKGDWAWKDINLAGDVVRYAGDFYQCVTDNVGGHPLYEDSAVSSKWVKIAETPLLDKSRMHIWFQNMAPMGWTRNNGEEGYHGAPNWGCTTINGNFQQAHIGYGGNQAHGHGETGGDWAWHSQINSSFDFYDYIDGYRPSITGGDPKLIQINGNDSTALALFDTGELYSCGYNAQGQLGDGTTTARKLYRRVGRTDNTRGNGQLRDKRVVKCGLSNRGTNQDHTDAATAFAITNNGEVWTWGWNNYGQVGDGTTTDRSATIYQIPQGFFHNKKVVDMWMAGGNYVFAYAQTQDGELYSWGSRNQGALGLGESRDVYRPERVKYDWAKYGGIKKVQLYGYSNEGIVIVLTNDGTLHGTGNIIDDSHSIFGSGSTNDTAIYNTWRFTPLARLLETKVNSLGYNRKSNSIGYMLDVTRNVENFWAQGSSYFNIFVKEKGTGLMYGWGYNGYGSMPVFNRAVGYPEQYDRSHITTVNIVFPTLLDMGNMTDIKHVQRTGSINAGFVFWNADGRLWSNGSGNNYTTRGIDTSLGAANPTMGWRRAIKLPWESFISDHVPTQTRFAEKACILTGLAEGTTTGGVVFTTTNNRLVRMHNSGYGWDVVGKGQVASPARADM